MDAKSSFQRRRTLVLSFLWQSADAFLVDARCCKLGHTQSLLSAVMEKGSGYMGRGTWGRSAGTRATEQLGRRCWVAVGVLLSPTLHGSQAELPTGSHAVPHWWMAAGI